MRVMMTTDTIGGVWTYAIQLTRALAAHNVSVHLATLGPAPTPTQRREAAAAGATLHESRYRLEWQHEPWQDVADSVAWLRELEDVVQPDVLHFNGYSHAGWAWTCPTIVVAHSCVCTWWQAVHGQPAPHTWDAYRKAIRRGLHGADVVVAPTAGMLETLTASHGPLLRTEIIHNGAASSDVPAPGATRDEVIFAAGRLWDEAKNIALLNEIADELPWPVCVAGDTVGPTNAGRMVPAVNCLGRLEPPALHDWQSRSAIYAHPAKYEPFGLAVLEAALGGCALVLSDIPTLRELWDGRAEFADPADPAAWRSTLMRLIADERRRQQLAQAARAHAATLTAARMAEAYVGIYRRLLSSRTTPTPSRTTRVG